MVFKIKTVSATSLTITTRAIRVYSQTSAKPKHSHDSRFKTVL
jgi:hypothetical protein